MTDHTLLDYFLVFFAVFVMPVMSAWAGRQLKRRRPGQSLVTRYGWMILRGWIVVAAVILVWAVLGRPFADLGLSPTLNLWDKAGLALTAIGLALLPLQLASLSRLSPDKLAQATKTIDRMKITPATRGELAAFIPLTLTAGVWEELLYRGFLIWFLTPLTGIIGAVILSALIFGAGHIYQGLIRVGITAGIGLVFAVLFVLSGTLWWLMAAHAVIDIYGGVTAYRVRRLAAAGGAVPG